MTMTIREMSRSPVLINTVGHYAGALLFCVILILFWRNWRIHGIRAVKLPLAAAALAFGWNVGSLLILGAADQHAAWLALVAAASFSMLSLLPAVLLQVVVQGKSRPLIFGGATAASSPTATMTPMEMAIEVAQPVGV